MHCMDLDSGGIKPLIALCMQGVVVRDHNQGTWEIKLDIHGTDGRVHEGDCTFGCT